nr:hypothetical protein [Tanacetum cinerariifolium]
KIRENIANQRSGLHGVFVSLAEPFSTAALTGTEGTSGIVSAASNTTTALSPTLASASTVPPITIEDYEVMVRMVQMILKGVVRVRFLLFPIHKEGRVLTDVVVHNPFAKTDYISALQKLQNVNFSLLAELMSNKHASVKTVMNILRLEDPLAKKLGLNELQPTV